MKVDEKSKELQALILTAELLMFLSNQIHPRLYRTRSKLTNVVNQSHHVLGYHTDLHKIACFVQNMLKRLEKAQGGCGKKRTIRKGPYLSGLHATCAIDFGI